MHFIEAHRYDVECVGLYEDNISTQLLIKNSKFFSGKKIKHVKAKFFFINERGDNREVRMIDCLQGRADILTKLLQGMVFRTMQVVLMNFPINNEDEEDIQTAEPRIKVADKPVPTQKKVPWKSNRHSHAPQECVGRNRGNLSKLTTDRWLGVSRIQRRASAPQPQTNKQ